MPTRFFFTTSFFIVSILTWFVFSPSVLAADCVDKPALGICRPGTPYSVSCSASSQGGISSSACCSSTAACTAFKNEFFSGSSNVPAGGGGSIKAWNPEGNCSGGIDTALGCLPYKSENSELSKTIFTLAVGITGALALVVMLVGTIQIMTAGGDPEAVKRGKELFTGAVMGLLFIIFSVTLLRLIAGDIIKLEGFT